MAPKFKPWDIVTDGTAKCKSIGPGTPSEFIRRQWRPRDIRAAAPR
jgi:hypothetical protein